MSSATLATSLAVAAWRSRRESTSRGPRPRGLACASVDVPPDQLAVVAAGDERLAGQRDAGDVALVARPAPWARASPRPGRRRRP